MDDFWKTKTDDNQSGNSTILGGCRQWNICWEEEFGKSEVGDEMMNRKGLEEYIQNNYSAEPDYPWIKYPNYVVFRHQNNKKWFALIMDVSKNKLGLQEDNILDVVNFKCSPILLGSLLDEKGFFPAYHMSKANCLYRLTPSICRIDEIQKTI